MLDEQMIDLPLWRVTPASDFANVDSIGARTNMNKHFRVNEIVVNDRVA